MNWCTFKYLIFRDNEISSLSLMDKICSLLSYCTVLNNEHCIYGLWIKLTNDIIGDNQNNLITTNIKLIVSLSHYMSNTTLESTIQKCITSDNEKLYFLIQLFEENTFSKGPLLTLRCDRYNEYGELVWLQKGLNVSGTDALAIENAISSALDLRWVYLHDDSKIQYGGNSKRGDARIYLKTIRTIAKGQSWYAQAYYKPFNCFGWPSESDVNKTGVPKGTVFNQNKTKYFNAVKYIRSYDIRKFRFD